MQYALHPVHNHDNHNHSITVGEHILQVRVSNLRKEEELLFLKTSRKGLGSFQCSMQHIGVPFTAVKRAGRDVGGPLKSKAEVKYKWSYTSTPPYIFMVLKGTLHYF